MTTKPKLDVGIETFTGNHGIFISFSFLLFGDRLSLSSDFLEFFFIKKALILVELEMALGFSF